MCRRRHVAGVIVVGVCLESLLYACANLSTPQVAEAARRAGEATRAKIAAIEAQREEVLAAAALKVVAAEEEASEALLRARVEAEASAIARHHHALKSIGPEAPAPSANEPAPGTTADPVVLSEAKAAAEVCVLKATSKAFSAFL